MRVLAESLTLVADFGEENIPQDPILYVDVCGCLLASLTHLSTRPVLANFSVFYLLPGLMLCALGTSLG